MYTRYQSQRLPYPAHHAPYCSLAREVSPAAIEASNLPNQHKLAPPTKISTCSFTPSKSLIYLSTILSTSFSILGDSAKVRCLTPIVHVGTNSSSGVSSCPLQCHPIVLQLSPRWASRIGINDFWICFVAASEILVVLKQKAWVPWILAGLEISTRIFDSSRPFSWSRRSKISLQAVCH